MVRDSVMASNEACVRLMIDLIVLEATASSGTQPGTGNNTSALAKPLYPTDTGPPVSGAPHTNAHAHGPSSLHRPKGRSGNPPPGQQMTLSAEQYLTYTITLTPNSKIKFSGRADYILGYHIPRVGTHTSPPAASGFLVVVEAKHTDWMQGVCQCLAYMGIVFCTRRKASKTNCTVWGVVSTGDTWVFVRIDNAGKATRSALYDISLPGHLEIVVGFFRGVIKVTSHPIPTTSPTERFLKMFGDKMNRRRWDSGVLSAEVLSKREVLERGGYVIEMPRVEEIFKGIDSGGANEAEEGEGTVELGSCGEEAGEGGDEDGNETEDEDEDDWEE
ncbi:hypothetical protein L211DRAFT_444186 [Terfezia boudieri ATCC MYA-4762]|uniref:Uncharacterized protein n=1 Tax=Terfezia boudieri ATCC MYA-4762 TaxID=1051890 RepID=A0A3N4LTM7_9PEZI|nr:hypothetical protein L211DRAFT_444186 [Terfezia boudieri ATCC MYA-4762]